MTSVVLDASAAIDAVLGTAHARQVLDALASATAVFAPDIYAAEVANALWKYVRAKEIDLDEAVEAMVDALGLVDELVPAASLGTEPLSEAVRTGHPVYDLCYAVVARRRTAEVVTRDRRLARLLSRLGIERAT